MPEGMQDRIVDDLRRSRKYCYVCEDTLERVAEWAAERHQKPRDAVKAAKRKLHQVYGSCAGQMDLRFVEERTAEIEGGVNGDARREVCLEILRRHASTDERLPILDQVFAALFAQTGAPASILDLACGLNPFALPWMGLPGTAQYHAVDIDRRLMDAVGRFLGAMGQAGSAACRDILVDLPQTDVDVALLLKALPGLEQQEKGISRALLQRVRAGHVVVSFPTISLGGKRKGMPGHYDTFMQRLIEGLGVPAEKIEFPGEVFYVLRMTF